MESAEDDLYPGGARRALEYDGLMRLKRLTSKAPGGNILLDYAYEYDDAGNIMSKSTEHGEYSYGYDGASRLTSAENPTGEDESYAYDEVGNRTSASNAEGEIVHNTNNELERYGELSYEYDANGNMTEVWQGASLLARYEYNADNRLIYAVTAYGALHSSYYYDPFGRRLWKEVNGVKTYFFYSDEGLVAEYGPGGAELRSYGYQPDSTWTTDPLWLKYNNAYYFYHNDHLGTPQKLTAQNGMVAWSAQYSAFGEATVDTEFITNNLRFPGQFYDEETGLHYNFKRYYDPEIGRYVSRDPIGFLGRDVNFYGYVGSNPTNVFDMLGLAACRCTCDTIRQDSKDEINDYINQIVQGGKGQLKAVFNELVPATYYKFQTAIEEWLYRNLKDITEVGDFERLGFAPCMRLCGHCVGTDKIGHFFEEGWIYREILQATGEQKYAIGYGEWLEGLVSKDPVVLEWIKTTTMTLEWAGGRGETPLAGTFGNAGDYHADPSLPVGMADLAANLAGLAFGEALGKHGAQLTFNICDYVKADWDEQINPNVAGDPRPEFLQ